MAQITISEILGSDSLAASRSVIMQNFKILADEANRIESYLNTSTTGATLSIGEIVINSTSNDSSAELFVDNASGKFVGNLTVGGYIECSGDASVAGDFTIGSGDTTITLSNDTTSLNIASANAILLNEAAYETSEAEGYEISMSGKGFIELEYDTESSSPSTDAIVYALSDAEEGQVIVIQFTGGDASGSFTYGDSTYEITDIADNATATFICHDGVLVGLSTFNCTCTITEA